MMINENPENTIYGSYGEFYSDGMEDWTDADWRQYDAYLAAEMEKWDSEAEDYWINASWVDDLSEEPPF